MAEITTRVGKGSALTNTEMDDNLTNLNTKPDLSSGDGAPGTTPSKVGDVYIDTTNDLIYVATGTASSADWDQVVATSLAQTLLNKTLTDVVLNGAITEETYTWTTTSGSVTTEFDPANGTVHTVTLTGNVTAVTDNVADGEYIILGIDDGASAYTFAGPTATVVTGAGTLPALPTTGFSWTVYWKKGSTLYAAFVGDGT